MSRSKLPVNDLEIVPPVEPEVHDFAPDELLPVVEVAPPEQGHWYWVGVKDDAPSSCFSVGGISFLLESELVEAVPNRLETRRTPLRGQVVKLTASQIRELAERLKRKVLRQVPGCDLRRGADVAYKPCTIETAEEIAAAAKLGIVRLPYQARVGDVPLADALYCVQVPDGRPRYPLDPTPPCISEIGLRAPRETVQDGWWHDAPILGKRVGFQGAPVAEADRGAAMPLPML